MAKFKPFRGKKKSAATPQGAVPCVVFIICAFVFLLLILYYVMKSFGS